jgi:hypothetical protein
MPKKAATQWSGGSVRIDTADKQRLVQAPQQQHNLSMAPNRCVLLTAPPNKGKSALCLQICARSAPFAKVFVLHGTPGTIEYDCIDHVKLEKMPDPAFWKEEAKRAKGKPLCVIVDDYSHEGLGKDEKRNMEMLLRTCASHLGILVLITAHAHTNIAPKWRRCCTTHVCWAPADRTSWPYLARGMNLGYKQLAAAFAQCAKSPLGKHSFVLHEMDPPEGRAPTRIDGETAFDVEPFG